LLSLLQDEQNVDEWLQYWFRHLWKWLLRSFGFVEVLAFLEALL